MDIHRSGDDLFNLDEFLGRPLFAHLATGSPDGPRESPVWFLWEESAIWLIGTSQDSFPKRVVNEPRCAIGIVDFDLERGLLQHVGMRGTATVEDLNHERLCRLLRRYLGENWESWNPGFVARVIDRIDLMIRFDPRSVVMNDQPYFK
ncbi:MAG: pyridoxamine 5'-phosphate oxidase family protein [Candidatus Eremiobacteraeota bacterium]|nr:pyridoxamine 5'-phosphate oxidase family protein [Candidatus Eremiobacteraeota bacterium]MBC5821625.1 pyridoxamine 5'-phosphate oxidase family protein [Candidatus Eremiobacteraeota bacterium]